MRFASGPPMIASRRSGLPERDRAAFDRYLAANLAHGQRDRAHARGKAAMNAEPESRSSQAAASAVVAALEDAWTAIRAHHPDVPEVVVVLGAGSEARRGLFKWGHFAAARWQVAGANRPEVLVSGEGLKRGGRAVLATLLHEAAHGLANTRGVKDTSRQGRWHNRRFAVLAGELGLQVDVDTKTGWSQTSLTDQLADRYAPQLTGLAAALGLWRHTERQLGPATASHNLLACSCACGRKLRVAKATLEQAPIICGSCKERFEPERALTLSRQPTTPPGPLRRRIEEADARRDLPQRQPRPGTWREQPVTTRHDPRERQRPAREGGHER
jgi:hypothetical protein